MTSPRFQHALILALLMIGVGDVRAQETEAATRQYAVAVGFQNQKLFDAAIDEWQTFLRKYPKDPRTDRAQHYLGTCCLQEKRFAEAISAFESVSSGNPKFELLDQSLLNLGIARYGQAGGTGGPEDFRKAITAFDATLKRFPDSQYAARALYYRGECLFQINRADEAAKSFAEFVRRYPDDELAADGVYALGTAQESLDQPLVALTTYTDFVNRFPAHELVTEVSMRRGEILFDAGRFDEAKPIFEAVSSNQSFALADVAMLRQARCLYEQGQISEAARLYWNVPREFRKTKHYDAAILAGAKCYILDEKYPLARSGLEQLVKRDVPEAAEATEWLARSFLKEGNPGQALQIAEQGKKRFRGADVRPELELVRIDALYEMPDRRPQTPALYAEFVRRNGAHELAPQAQYMAALGSLDTQDYAAAKSYSEEFLKQFPNSELKPDVLFVAAESRLLLAEYSEAADLYQTFLGVGASHANANLAKVRRGLALHMAGEHDQVVRWLGPLVETLSDRPLQSEAFSILGRSFAVLEQFDKAAEMLQNGISADTKRPQNDEAYLALAEVFRKTGRDSDADAQLSTLLSTFPGSRLAAEAWFRLGESAYAGQKYQDALKAYQKVADTWPADALAPHAQYGLGWTLFNMGDFQKSADALSRLLQKYRTSDVAPKGLYVRAMASYQLGSYTDVLRDVDSFLATRPASSDALDAQYVKGLAEAGLEKFEDAARTYQAILKNADQYPAADKVAYELGWALVELGRTDEAVAAFGRLARDWPNSPLAAEGLFRVAESYYDAEKYAEAATAYRQSADKSENPEIAEKSMHKLGWSLLKGNDVKAAAEAFAEQLSQHPGGELSGDGRFLIGECRFKLGDWPQAAQAFEQVVNDGNSNYVPLAMFRIGECSAARQDWAASQMWHQKVLEAYPDFEMRPEARYGLAWALQNREQYDRAVPLYEQVTEESQSETAAKARFMIGECCFAQKQHKEATKHFLKAAFLYNHQEWSAMAWFEAARCFEVLKDIEQARSCYEQLIAKYPSHAKVRDAKRRLDELKRA